MSQARDEFDALMRSKEKRSRHPADDDDDNNNNGHGNNDDARSFLNLSDNDDDEEGGSRTPSTSDPPPRPSLSQSCNVIPLTRYDANTGPKGVIADAQHFRDSRRMHRQSMRSEASLAPPAPSYQHQLLQQQQHSTQHHQRNGRTSLQQAPRGEKQRVESDDEGTQESKDNEDDDNDEDEDDDEDDERDDAFMHQWRTSRLRELQTGSRGGRVHPPASSRRKRMTMYGGLATVDGPGYLSAVDDSPPDTVVVVYIYDDQSSVSTAIEDCLRLLARKHVETRFVRLHYADAEMERAGVPALLAYVGGEKFAGLVPVLLEIPEEAELSAATLEAVMRSTELTFVASQTPDFAVTSETVGGTLNLTMMYLIQDAWAVMARLWLPSDFLATGSRLSRPAELMALGIGITMRRPQGEPIAFSIGAVSLLIGRWGLIQGTSYSPWTTILVLVNDTLQER